MQYFTYKKPVLMSEPQLWFNGGRHIILVQPETCAAVVTWANQARDYMIRPKDYDLRPGSTFASRIRHVIAPVEYEDDLEKLWAGFEEDLTMEST